VGNADEVRASFRTRVPLLISYLRINLAKGRFLPLDGNRQIRVHRAVKLRMDHPEMFVDGPYTPRAGPWDKAEPVWVD